MPQVTEQQAISALNLAKQIDDPEKKKRLGAVVAGYRDQQASLGEPMFAETKRAEIDRTQKVRSLFQDRETHGLEPENLQELNAAYDFDDEGKAALFNSQWIEHTFGLDPEKARAARPDLIREYSKEKWGKPIESEKEFADRLGEDFDTEDAANDFGQSVGLRGLSPIEAYNQLPEELANSETFRAREFDFRQQYEATARATSARLQPYRQTVAGIVGDLQEKTGVTDTGEDDQGYTELAQSLMEVPEADRGLVLASIIENAGDGEAKGAAQKLAENFARGARDLGVDVLGFSERDLLQQLKAEIRAGSEIGENPAEWVTNTRSAILDSGSVIGTGGAAQFFGPEGVELNEQQKAAIEEVDRRIGILDMHKQLRQIADEEIDPAKGEHIVSNGLYQAARSIPYTIAALAGPAGFMATSTALAEDSYHRLRAENPGMDADTAFAMAGPSGLIQGGLERISGKILTGRLPAVERFFNKVVATKGATLARFGTRAAAGTALELTQENLQDLTPFAVQGTISALSEDVPSVPWNDIFGDMAENQGELFFAVLPLTLIGAGVGTVRDYKGASALMSNYDSLRAVGIGEAAANEIRTAAQAGNLEKAQSQLRKEFREIGKDTQDIQQTRAEVAGKAATQKRERAATLAKAESIGILPAMGRTAEGWTLRFEGGSTRTFDTHTEADAARWQFASDNSLAVHESTRGVIQSVESQLEAGREVSFTFEQGGRSLLDAVQEGEVSREAALNRADIAEQEGGTQTQEQESEQETDPTQEYEEAFTASELAALSEDDKLAAFSILGSNKTEFADGVQRTTIKLFQGATPLTVIEEKLEGDADLMLKGGRRDWLVNSIRQYERTSGDRVFLTDKTDDQLTTGDIREAWSHLGQSYFAARSRKGDVGDRWKSREFRDHAAKLMRSPLGSAFEAYSRFFRAVWKRAARLNKLRREGKLDADLERELARSVGFGEQQEYEAGVEAEARALREEVENAGSASKPEQASTVEPTEDAPFSVLPVTSNQDAEYLAAVESGDMDAAQRMVDEAAKRAGYDSPKVHHGTGAEFVIFGNKGKITGARSAAMAYFFTVDEPTAKAYAVYAAEEGPIKELMDEAEAAERRGDWDSYDAAILKAEDLEYGPETFKRRENARVVDAYLKGDWLEFDAEGKTPQELAGGDIDAGISSLIEEAKNQGKSGVIFRNLDDAVNLSDRPADHYAVFDPNQIKSADPVTRDESGNVIPLSERFNPETDNINFSVLPNAETRAAAMFSPFLSNPETKRRIMLEAQRRVSEKAREWQEVFSKNRTAASLNREAQVREGLEYDRLLRDELGAITQEQQESLPAVDRAAARSDAKKVASDWLKEQRAALSNIDRATLIGAMRTLDAMTSALPMEIRGKMGGMVKLAQFKGPEAMITELERRAKKFDEILEDWLSKEADKQIRKLFKIAVPAKDEVGKKRVGKAGADIHDLFDQLRDVYKQRWTAERAEGHALALEAEVAKGEMSPEREAHAIMEAEAVRLLGGWHDQYEDSGKKSKKGAKISVRVKGGEGLGAEARNHALDTLTDIWKAAYADFQIKKKQEKEQRDQIRADLQQDTGKKGTGGERDLAELAGVSKAAKSKEVMLSLLNFDQLVFWAFGEKSKWGAWFADQQRQAENTKDDRVRETVESVEDFFTKLAGGNRFAGEKLQYRMSNKKTHPLTATDSLGDTRTLSEMEALTVLLMWQQEDGQRHMKGKRDEDGKIVSTWAYDADFVDELSGQITAEGWATLAYLQEQYGGEYEGLNEVYSELHGVNLPHNANYSPLTMKPQQAQGGQTVDPVTGTTVSGASMTPGSLRTRGTATAEPEFRDALATFIGHKKQIEHWMAYARFSRDAQAVLGNREVGNSVEAAHGKEAVTLVRKWLDAFAQGGTRDAAAGLAMSNFMRRTIGNFSSMALVGRVGTLAIQATQLGAAAAKMPVGAYVVRMGKLLSGNMGWGAALDSPYIQRRMAQQPIMVQQAMEGLRAGKPTRIKHQVRKIGNLIGGADALFTAGTYAMIYDYQLSKARRDGFTGPEAEAFARNEAERITDEVAQPTRMGARSFLEVSSTSPFMKMAWAFGSEARKNLGLMGFSLLKRSPAEKARAILYVVGINSMLASVIRSAWRDMRDDEDDELFDEKHWNPKRLALATSTEWLFGFPVIGEEIQRAIYTAAGEWMPEGGPLSAVSGAVPAGKNLFEGDSEDVLRDVEKIMTAIGLFEDNTAAATSIMHLIRDTYGLGKNFIR